MEGRTDRGAILVHTAIALVGLLGFSAMTVDYGVLWVARAQAQNAADAAALAATMTLAYGNQNDTARVRNIAKATAAEHTIWGATAAVQDSDVVIGTCPSKTPGSALLCVSVTVHRNQGRGNALPTFFAQLLGVANQGVVAVATGQVAQGADATCIKPWAVPDKWVERRPNAKAWTNLDLFERYNVTTNNRSNPTNWAMHPNPDFYTAASGNSAGSGYRAPDDVGVRFYLRTSQWDDTAIGSGSFRRVEMANPNCSNCNGNNLMKFNIETCNPNAVQVNGLVSTQPGDGGTTTVNSLNTLLAGDSATWVCADGGSAVGRDCMGYPSTSTTKRLVALPAFNVQKYMDDAKAGLANNSSQINVQVTRIVGFFIESHDSTGIRGRFSYIPATGNVTNTIPDPASFLRKVVLVR